VNGLKPEEENFGFGIGDKIKEAPAREGDKMKGGLFDVAHVKEGKNLIWANSGRERNSVSVAEPSPHRTQKKNKKTKRKARIEERKNLGERRAVRTSDLWIDKRIQKPQQRKTSKKEKKKGL